MKRHYIFSLVINEMMGISNAYKIKNDLSTNQLSLAGNPLINNHKLRNGLYYLTF